MTDSEIEYIVRHNVSRVVATVADACRKAARSDPVKILAVTKYAPIAAVRALANLGRRDLAENRVQQLAARAKELGFSAESMDAGPPGAESPPRWHLIGHLQRNKVKAFLHVSRILHSLDSLRLAEELSAQATRLGATVDCFVEVNLSREANKTGISPKDAGRDLPQIAGLPGLRLIGLMTMGPLSDDPETARPAFAGLRECLEDWRRRGVLPESCRELSMGMSHDYPVAIAEGATWIRVGSALFEGLPPPA